MNAIAPYAPDQTSGASFRNVAKHYGSQTAIADLTLEVGAGEFLCLLGPSGCGKTTLLRLLAGLLAPDAGSVAIGGRVMADARRRLFIPPEKRHVGMVFQDYALWPHLRVAENVAFPLQVRGAPKSKLNEAVAGALRRVGLEALSQRYPAQLSGGQQQRVALARAIAPEPPLLLFDEPLSNLDASLRESLARDLAGLVRGLGVTSVYVTHDQAEALALGDRIAVIRDGKVEQVDRPEALYARPANPWVAAFLNAGSLVAGHCATGRFLPVGEPQGTALPESMRHLEGPATLCVPSVAVRVEEAPDAVPFVVRTSWFRGDRYEIDATWGCNGGPPLKFWHDRALPARASIPVRLVTERLRVYPGRFPDPDSGFPAAI